MSLETVGATDWWKGRKLFGMANNKGHSHSGNSYSGKGPRLARSNANRSIEYDSTGSYRRRRSRQNDDDDESDLSNHSRDGLGRVVDDFSVHGKQDLPLMNDWLRSHGLPAPASLGIDTQFYEQIKRTSSMGSPHDGFQYTPRPEGRIDLFSRQDSDLSPSDRASPSPGSDPCPYPPAVGQATQRGVEPPYPSAVGQAIQRGVEPPSPSAVGQATQRGVELPAPSIRKEQTTTGAEARAVENRVGTSSGGATPNQFGESDGAARTGKPSYVGFADVVGRAVKQHQNRLKEEADSLERFIDSHGGSDLPRQWSMPSSLENAANPSTLDTTSPAGEPIERAYSEPISVPSLRPRTTSPDAAKLENRDQDSEYRSFSTKVDSRRPQERRDSNSKSVSVLPPSLLKPLKPPPPGPRGLRIEPGQFSSMDMLNSLAPDTEDIVPVEFSESDDDERKSDTDGEQESANELEVTLLADDVQSKKSSRLLNGTDLTVDVPDRMLRQIAQVKIDDNPEPVVARTPVVPVGPKHPWSKGDVLGQGSFGTVYDAVDSDGMWFAVKEVSMVENDKQAQQSIAQLMQEIELLSQFKHENVVQYLGTEKEHGKLYIFLELVSKGSLASICKRIQLNHSQISAYTRQILKGLKYLHDRNIVHRDIKCANILVDTTGTCKVADFGMAKQMQSMDQMKSCKGSAYWMAPEVIDPKKVSGLPADIWSLGCSILEMATGSPPFGDMEWYRVLWTVGHGNAPPIPDTLSETAKDFVKQCLDVNPLKRPNATELLNHPFVRQDGPSTPSSQSSGINLSDVSSILQTITEEQSADFDKASSTKDGNTLSNGHSETTSS